MHQSNQYNWLSLFCHITIGWSNISSDTLQLGCTFPWIPKLSHLSPFTVKSLHGILGTFEASHFAHLHCIEHCHPIVALPKLIHTAKVLSHFPTPQVIFLKEFSLLIPFSSIAILFFVNNFPLNKNFTLLYILTLANKYRSPHPLVTPWKTWISRDHNITGAKAK